MSRADDWLKMREKGAVISSLYENPSKGWVNVSYDGIPSEIKPVAADGIYRHYVKKHGALKFILDGLGLKEGDTPLWFMANNGKMTYSDVRGVFLTRPWVRPETVGCGGACGYVDVLIPEKTPLFKLPFYDKAASDVFVTPGESQPAALPVVIAKGSHELPKLTFSSPAELFKEVAALKMPQGLDILSYEFAGDWEKLMMMSGLAVDDGVKKYPSGYMHHGMAHLMSTAALSVWIGGKEFGGNFSEADAKTLWLSGLLHDIGRATNYGAMDEEQHAAKSADYAGYLFEKLGIDAQIAGPAINAISKHNKEKSGTDPILKILKDADSLERFRLGSAACDPKYLSTRSAKMLFEPMMTFYNPPAEYPETLQDVLKAKAINEKLEVAKEGITVVKAGIFKVEKK